MRPKSKLIFRIALITLCVFLGYNNVDAATNKKYSLENWPQCVKNKSCYSLCGYTNKISGILGDNYYSAYIYVDYSSDTIKVLEYNKNGENTITMTSTSTNVVMPDTVKNLFFNEGKCPSAAYINNVNKSESNLCFDNNGVNSKCTVNYTGGNQKYVGTSTKEYDYENNVKAYFDSVKQANISCNEFVDSNSKEKSISNYTDSIEKRFKSNKFEGKNIPLIVKKSSAYKSGMKEVENAFVEKCLPNFTAESNDNSNTETSENNADTGTAESNNTVTVDTNTPDTSSSSSNKEEYEINLPEFEGGKMEDCSSILPVSISKALTNIMNFLKYLGPILAALFTIFELARGAVTGKVDGKKIGANFGKRMLAAIAIFFVVMFVGFLLESIGITAPVDCFR